LLVNITSLRLVHRSRKPVFFNILPLIYRVYFPCEKRTGRDAGYSILLSAEVKNVWSYTSNLPICVDKGSFAVFLRNPSLNSHILCISYCINKRQCLLHVAVYSVVSYTVLQKNLNDNNNARFSVYPITQKNNPACDAE
jgi:hypothetical protein